MKKYLLMALCAGLLFTATGCGDEKKEESSKKEDNKTQETVKNKVLSCSTVDSDDVMLDVDATFTFDKDGKNLSDMTTAMTMNMEEQGVDEITDEMLEQVCAETESQDEVKSCKAKASGKKIIVDVAYDVSKITGDDYEFSKESSIDDIKKAMEEDGDVTCKIEEK